MTYSGNKFYDEYRLKVHFFIEKDKEVHRLQNKKDLLKLLDQANKKQVDRFIKDNQLFLKREADILKVLQYLDQL